MSLEMILGLEKKLVMKSNKYFFYWRRVSNFHWKYIDLVNVGENILIEWEWTKTIAHYESYGKTDHKSEHNIREYYISGW